MRTLGHLGVFTASHFTTAKVQTTGYDVMIAL